MIENKPYIEPIAEIIEFSIETQIATSALSSPKFSGLGEEADWNSID